MKNTILYLVTVLIWGSTWLAIEFQLGEVPVEISLVYRFGFAALVMWVFCLWRGVPLKFTRSDHFFILLLALGNFSVNYMFMYLAQEHLTSAMTSIAFSTMLLMNIINTRIFFGTKIEIKTYLGGILGVLGIVMLFWDDLVGSNLSDKALYGLALVMTGTLIASFGNMCSVRNSKKGLNIFAVNAWGMLYGTLALILFAAVKGSEFSISYEPSYLASLIYLSVFGTVIAFASYFELLKNMGPEKASYAVVLFPIVAVCLSSLFEGFVWSTTVIVGFIMVLLGNFIVLTPLKKLRIILFGR
jgi:drug/metabolite transporter (DMT)-like permease